MKVIKSPGMICLAAFLILSGLSALLHLGLGPVNSLLAVAAGVLILIGK